MKVINLIEKHLIAFSPFFSTIISVPFWVRNGTEKHGQNMDHVFLGLLVFLTSDSMIFDVLPSYPSTVIVTHYTLSQPWSQAFVSNYPVFPTYFHTLNLAIILFIKTPSSLTYHLLTINTSLPASKHVPYDSEHPKSIITIHSFPLLVID